MYGCRSNGLFALKSLMKVTPFETNFGALVVLILIFAQALRISEAPLVRVTDNMDHYNYWNSVWDIFLVVTTVGYGDFFPRT